jgi:RAT1-interacting protein
VKKFELASIMQSEKLDKMLEWIVMNKAPFVVDDQSTPLQSLSTDFVCFRGLLTTLMCTPYEKREDWEFVALKYKETIYLCSIETEQKRLQEQHKNDRQKQMASWGYKFEQFILSDSISEDEDNLFDEAKKKEVEFNDSGNAPSMPNVKPVNENEEFCCVFRSRLGGHSIVYGAEVDGFRLRTSQDTRDLEFLDLNSDGDFIELKTSRKIDNNRLAASFAQYKALKWWAQSFLVGIRKIVCGF